LVNAGHGVVLLQEDGPNSEPGGKAMSAQVNVEVLLPFAFSARVPFGPCGWCYR
jgi:hypothetical protein